MSVCSNLPAVTVSVCSRMRGGAGNRMVHTRNSRAFPPARRQCDVYKPEYALFFQRPDWRSSRIDVKRRLPDLSP